MYKNRFFLFLALVFFLSCNSPGREIHIHNSHVHSYKVIKDFAGSSPAPALVLFDYHPGIDHDPARHFNWIGSLLSEDVISAVYWVSEFSAENQNYEAGIDRLDEVFAPMSPQTARQIKEKIRLMDFLQIERIEPQKDFIVSVDLSILEYEKQTPPAHFLQRMLQWIHRQNPRLLTVALTGEEPRFSATMPGYGRPAGNTGAYQLNNDDLYAYLTEILQSFSCGREARPFFPPRGSVTAMYLESETQTEGFAKSYRFIPGRSDPWIWYSLPAQCVELLKKKNIVIKGENRENILSVWNDPGYKKLRESYDKKRQKEILQSARDSVFRFWNDAEIPALPPQGSNEGLAVRLLVHGNDRGCLTWYKNSGDMNLFAAYCAAEALRDPRYETVNPSEAENTLLELSIFGDWEDMPGPREFIPGYHNLWLSGGGRNTILQASLVPQRNYTKEEFLENICQKAGLDKNAWKENTILRWKRSPGLWLVEPLVLSNN